MVEDLVLLYMIQNFLFLTVCSIYPSWPAAVSSQQWTTGSATTTTCVNSTTISPTSSSSLYTPPICPKTHSYTLFFYFGVAYTLFPYILLRNRSRWDGNAVCSSHKVSSFSVEKSPSLIYSCTVSQCTAVSVCLRLIRALLYSVWLTKSPALHVHTLIWV